MSICQFGNIYLMPWAVQSRALRWSILNFLGRRQQLKLAWCDNPRHQTVIGTNRCLEFWRTFGSRWLLISSKCSVFLARKFECWCRLIEGSSVLSLLLCKILNLLFKKTCHTLNYLPRFKRSELRTTTKEVGHSLLSCI